jgi:hypothetical protein
MTPDCGAMKSRKIAWGGLGLVRSTLYIANGKLKKVAVVA